MIVQDKL